jgi:4'-phosphopantetheinyl transferase
MEAAQAEVWKIAPSPKSVGLVNLLPEDERLRLALLPEGARPAYAAGRLALRHLLGDAIGARAADVKFDYRCRRCGNPSHGKPLVVGEGAASLDFSISYSDTLALVAIGRHCRVGVDIERVAATSVAYRWCFAEAERAFVAQLPGELRDLTTTEAWVRKEAVGKGRGLGLAMPLSDAVLVGERKRWHLPWSEWQVKDLPVGVGIVAAIAYDVRDVALRVSTWAWPET